MLSRFLLLACLLAAPLSAAIADLRITELRPDNGTVEVTNTASDTFSITDNTVQFCSRLFYYSLRSLNGNTDINFTAGSRVTLTLPLANAADSDTALYMNINVMTDFDTAANMIHFVKWGPQSSVGRSSLAVTAGLWTSINGFVPAPASGSSLTWDENGFTPEDWYIDATPTPGNPDSTTPNSIANNIAWPSGTQTFENLSPGDMVDALTNWPLVDTGADPTRYWVRAAADGATTGNRPAGTTTWLRVRDQNAADSNRFYSETVTAPSAPTGYTWTWYFLVETPASAAAALNPRFAIQHDDGGMQNAWAIELDDTQFNLIVTGIGGTAASTPITAATTGTWHQAQLFVDFGANTVNASIDGGTFVSLPINLSGTANPGAFRFCYRGEGTDNTASILIDDISFASGVPGSGGGGGGDDDGGCSTGESSAWWWLALLSIPAFWITRGVRRVT